MMNDRRTVHIPVAAVAHERQAEMVRHEKAGLR